ncbi:MAG: cadherin domain-containing protein, partial [Acidiferrobacterales bacterium]
MKWLLLTAVTFLLFAAPARADYKEGLAALQRGDYAAAHGEFLQLAKEGHASAQYSLGFLYDYGEGVQQNHSEAAKWYRKAAEQGLAGAQFSLGIMYESGTGVSRDLARAYKWYSVAAETHAPGRARDTVIESRDLIANQLSRDQLAAAQKMIASFWTASAPKPTHETSGTSAAEGRTATADQGAAEAPDGGAITSERARYESALAALQSRDYVTAYRRILPLANQGHAHAQYTVGFLYAFGRGVEQDYDVAVKWYRLAAKRGLPEAQIALGIMYESGTGVPRDLNESHRRYSLAVENLTLGKTRDTAIEQRDRVAKLLSQEQLATEQLNAAPTDIALSNNKVAENAPPGTLVGTVSAHDPDAGDGLIYGLTEGGSGRFVIDPASGALRVAKGARLDFEASANFELTVTATDGGGLTDSATVTVSLDDVNEAPGDLAMAGGRVAENAPSGTHVATVSARDPDAGDSLVY